MRDLDNVREVADAVLYEGYLLYPYRATSAKNQVRWQFGVLGPPSGERGMVGEEASMHVECLLHGSGAEVGVHLRFLQLQFRDVQRVEGDAFVSVGELTAGGPLLYAWDEAVEREIELGPYWVAELRRGVRVPVEVPGGEDREDVAGGRVIRRRWPLRAEVAIQACEVMPGTFRLTVDVANTATDDVTDHTEATRLSFLSAHLLLPVDGGAWVSSLDPPDDLADVAAGLRNRRCWPVLAGAEGSTDLVLASPIILYDYPAVAPESAGSLFDATEIDEILTLRIMTMSDEEKAQARATDPAAAAIIDRCDEMNPQTLARLHGALRDPHIQPTTEPRDLDMSQVPTFGESTDQPWWDPGVDASVDPATDVAYVDGAAVRKGSKVRINPSRRADAQDLFFAGRAATVTGVFHDVDGETHVAVVIDDDPAADLHEWYGRYLYFAPDELTPLVESEEPASNR